MHCYLLSKSLILSINIYLKMLIHWKGNCSCRISWSLRKNNLKQKTSFFNKNSPNQAIFFISFIIAKVQCSNKMWHYTVPVNKYDITVRNLIKYFSYKTIKYLESQTLDTMYFASQTCIKHLYPYQILTITYWFSS